jgi:hypothetical protein
MSVGPEYERSRRAKPRASEAVGEFEGRSPSINFGTATGFCERLRRLFHWDSCVDRLGRAAPGAKNRRNNGPLKSIEDAREAGATLVNAAALLATNPARCSTSPHKTVDCEDS